MRSEDVYIVIVFYKRNLHNSQTISSLLEIEAIRFQLLIYDNSPIAQYVEEYFTFKNLNCRYVSDTNNPGLSTAYNYALKHANLENKDWILLLDQDTYLSPDYFKELFKLTIDDSRIVSVIPRVNDVYNNMPISPSTMKMGVFCRPTKIQSGLVLRKITGINSATVLRVDFLNKLGGFSLVFVLDYLDHWYFREIYKSKKYVFLMETVVLQDLSVSPSNSVDMSKERYISIFLAQMNYVKLQGALKLFLFKLFLLFRGLFIDKRLSVNELVRFVFTRDEGSSSK